MHQHLAALTEFGKMTFSGVVPTGGAIGRQADELIAELVTLGAIPVRQARKAVL